MSIKPSKVPLLSQEKGDAQKNFDALHESLYPRPVTYVPIVTGLTGSPSGIVTSTGRHSDISITITGPTISTAGTVTCPVMKVMNSILSAFELTSPPTVLGYCGIDDDGLITLPNWNTANNVLILGSVVEA